jgi:acyl-CoA synthetase (NDP forming)
VKVCQSLEEFEDLTKLSVFWSDKKLAGNKVGIVSNAGFECTVSADNLQNLKLADLSPATYENLRVLLPPGIVDLHHPIDATPITNSEKFAGIVKALLDDPNVDLILASPLPPTQALENLAPGADHPEDIYRPGSLPSRLIELNRLYHKPILACIDAGPLYEPCVELLESNGVPCLRKIDRAVKALSLFIS